MSKELKPCKDQEIADLKQQLADAKDYAKRLFKTLSPQCEPDEDLTILLTQIDNWCAGRNIELAEAGTEPSSPWISVEDNLPDDMDAHLWSSNVPGPEILMFGDKELHFEGDYGFTHWMPIPPIRKDKLSQEIIQKLER